MVKSKDQVNAIVRAYAREVAKHYRIASIILFGSYASGNPTDMSDIDIAIVSSDFQGKPEMEVLEHLSRLAMNIDSRLEVLAFTPDEIESPDPRSFSYEVKSRGIPIAA